jgi:perosamine synthetase
MSGLIPYGRQSLDDEDIAEVVRVLRSDWLTTGPEVPAFEGAFASRVGVGHAVAVSSGTGALHGAMYAIGIGPGDEVIVPAMTFAASSNCVLYEGGAPVFCDVEADTLLIDPLRVREKITERTRAVVAVDYAGQPCDYDALRAITEERGLYLIADACHAVGATYRGRAVGGLADLTAFSFHPVKHLTTGEGGMITTDDGSLAGRARSFRNHGISTDFREREGLGTWCYEMTGLGYNYRITDFQCALGRSQLRKLSGWLERRSAIAGRYGEGLKGLRGVRPLGVGPGRTHAYHLYVVRVDARLTVGRKAVFERMRAKGVGVNVHYIPVHLHPYYQKHWGTKAGQCPVAESAYEEVLSLPMFPMMTDEQVDRVIDAVRGSVAG